VNIRTSLCVLTMAAVASLAACGPTPAQVQLTGASQACANGDRNACAAVPGLNAQAQYEQQQQATGAAVAAGVAGIVGGAALGAATAGPDRYYYGRPYYRGHRYWR
jgi:hypothetical protein